MEPKKINVDMKTGLFTTKVSRINVVVGACLVSAPAFLSKDSPNLAMVYICCRRSSQLILTCEYFWPLVMLDPVTWPYKVYMILTTVLSAGEVLNVFGVNEMAMRGGKVPPSYAISLVLMYVPAALASFYALRLLFQGRILAAKQETVHQTSFSVNKLPTPETTQHVERKHNDRYQQEYMFLHKAYVVVVLGMLALVIAIVAAYWRMYTMDDVALLLHNITVIIFELLVIVLGTQNLKFKVYFNMVSAHMRTRDLLYPFVVLSNLIVSCLPPPFSSTRF
jgi:hypothetical protein